MRIRTFVAPNMGEALREVRKTLGRDAIILGSQQTADGIELTAAVDPDTPIVSSSERAIPEEPGQADSGNLFVIRDNSGDSIMGTDNSGARDDDQDLPEEAERLLRSIAFHGAPVEVNEQVCRRAAMVNDPSLVVSLAAGIEGTFRFNPLDDPGEHAVTLVGPPGAGKTVVAAKYAVEAALRGRPLKIATTDIERPGGEMRLMELAELVDNRPVRLAPGRRLDWSGPRLIDTEGVNPFDRADMARLKETVRVNDTEPLLVLPAGGDPYECEDIAHAFAELGVRRLIVTRLDTARRLGGLLAAAGAGLAFAGAGASPVIADGLYPLTPLGLARLILKDPDGVTELEEHRKHA